jgi:dTDP-glucose 4,6-dehydratase
MKKKFLVLGSNSFSGSNFINFLLQKNCSVVGISRSNEYKRIYLPYKGSINLRSFKFYKININTNLKKLKFIIKKFRPHYVVNYIAQGMVSESWLNPEDWYETNIVAQVKLYKELFKFKFIKKFIHVSTPEVYGATRGKIKENFNFNPSTPYAISRATADIHLNKYFINFKLPVIFTRTANVYGPYQQLYRIVPKALLFARLNKKIDLHGNGTSKRSFIFIDDASAATYLISIKGKVGSTYHISTDKIISIKNLVKKISKITMINYNNLANITKDRIGKDSYYNLNSKKIKKEFNWKAKIDLSTGLKRTLQWIDNNLANLATERPNYIHKK